MFRIDTANNVDPKPTYTPVGTPGWFQDDDPAGGTWVSAEWLNHIQEELAACIEGLGGTLDKADDNQLADLLVPRLTDEGHWATSVEVGGSGIGTGTTKISESGGVGKIQTDDINADGDITGDGDTHVEGQVRVGGDAQAGTGAKVTLDGATGDVDADGDVTVGGQIAAAVLALEQGANSVTGTYTYDSSAFPIPPHSCYPIPGGVPNTAAVLGATVVCWVESNNGSGIPAVVETSRGLGTGFYVTLANIAASGNVDGTQVKLGYLIIPAKV